VWSVSSDRRDQEKCIKDRVSADFPPRHSLVGPLNGGALSLTTPLYNPGIFAAIGNTDLEAAVRVDGGGERPCLGHLPREHAVVRDRELANAGAPLQVQETRLLDAPALQKQTGVRRFSAPLSLSLRSGARGGRRRLSRHYTFPAHSTFFSFFFTSVLLALPPTDIITPNAG
jgi:hypothetical protein